jgi:pilus assembly protein CpaF
MLTLRISRFQSISLEGLESIGYAPHEVLNYLSGIVMLGAGSLLIAGEVGTGKTTLVRALASVIEDNEALLVIEDTNEINLKRRFVRTLLTRESNLEGNGRVSPAQAIRAGMRMAMNRIVLGEIRDGEAAEAFVDVCASGHPGMSTIHAKSGRDALSRLELFLARSQGDIGVDTIRRQIANAISVVIFVGIDRLSGTRRILSVNEVDAAFDGAVQMSPMYEFDNSSEEPLWIRGSGVSNYHEELRRVGIKQSLGGSRIS